MLEEYPSAFVAAINPEGIFVPMPDSVPLGAHQRLHARSALDLVVPAERELVITTW